MGADIYVKCLYVSKLSNMLFSLYDNYNQLLKISCSYYFILYNIMTGMNEDLLVFILMS